MHKAVYRHKKPENFSQKFFMTHRPTFKDRSKLPQDLKMP
jgi:hypothetical protein